MTVRIIQGDARTVLAGLPADSFDCIVTSPPYYGLRDYGTATWEGGDPACDHRQPSTHVGPRSTLRNDGRDHIGPYAGEKALTEGLPFKDMCGKCGSRRIDQQIGLEPTLDEYLETMVAVCRELRRVLKPSGCMFLNIGDSYSVQHVGRRDHGTGNSTSRLGPDKDGLPRGTEIKANSNRCVPGFKPKDLMLVPERLGIALQSDGWWVRSKIIWHKKNPMPESVTDRPTSAHETIWMLTKSARYFWDTEAVKEEGCGDPDRKEIRHGNGESTQGVGSGYRVGNTNTRNIRNVWHVASHPFPGAHFATMPPEIAVRCIKAGSSERGCCPACGAPWGRVTDRNAAQPYVAPSDLDRFGTGEAGVHRKVGSVYQKWLDENPKQTLGWQPSCKCQAADPVPARILDPFSGAGTTGLVADRLGRDCTLIDLNTSYIDLAVSRIRDDAPLFAEVAAG